MGGLSNRPIPNPSRPPKPQTKWGIKKSFHISAKQFEINENVSTFENTLPGCEVIPQTIVLLLRKPQMSERRSNAICVAVVEWPDHNSVDDLVYLTMKVVWLICLLMHVNKHVLCAEGIGGQNDSCFRIVVALSFLETVFGI